MTTRARHGNVVISSKGFIFNSSGKSLTEAIVSATSFASPQPGNDEVQGDIASWGSDNLLPQSMTKDIETTGVLWAGLDAKSRIAIGKGPMPARIIGFTDDGYEQLQYVNDPQIFAFLEDNKSFIYSYATMRDLFGYGNPWTQILTDSSRTNMLHFKRIDPVKCRFEKINEATGRIDNVYVSGDWAQYTNTGSKDKHMVKVPLLDRDYPLYDLQSRKKDTSFMLSLQYPLSGRHYYAPAPWYTAKKWVKIAQGIPEMKEAMFKNQAKLLYQVDIHPDFWKLRDVKYDSYNDEKKAQVQDDFYDSIEKNLIGGENAYKSLFVPKVFCNKSQQYVPALTINVIDDKIKDGKLLPDSAAANIEILLPLMINAALLGVDMPGGGAYGGGAGSGSNIREAYLVQVMLVELERQLNSTVFTLAKKMNGWDSSIVFRYPNQILTTLNTGKNTQPTA